MFPKKGKYFPNGYGKGISYSSAIAIALRSELGSSHQAAKTVMRWTGANERTVKNWLSGRRGPCGEHLLALLRHSHKVLEAILQLAGREQIIAAKSLLDTRDALAAMLSQIDSFIKDGRAPQ
ncbi:MAG: hypothetical protein ACRD9W_05375 [Terriglobia bacterium]